MPHKALALLTAQSIARKLRAMDKIRWEQAQAARAPLAFQVVLYVKGRYRHSGATLHAACHASACRQFLKAWPSRMQNCAVVLRAPCGKRYDHDASARLVGQMTAWGVEA